MKKLLTDNGVLGIYGYWLKGLKGKDGEEN